MNKAIIVDKDGVLIQDGRYIWNTEEVILYPDVIRALQLVDKKTKIIIITNQGGIALGKYSEEDYIKVRKHIHKIFEENNISIGAEYFCPHHPKGTQEPYNISCNCRKPGTELFEKAIIDFNLNPEHCWTIGDMRRDIIAGQRVGMKGILVKTGFGGQGGEGDEVTPDYVAENLLNAIEYINKQEEREERKK